MKRTIYLIGILILSTQGALASVSCVAGTLASYIALSSGCTIGTDTFSAFQGRTNLPGAAISTSNVFVTPSGTTTSPTLTFTLQPTVTSQPGSPRESIFSYTITGSNLTQDQISVSNVSATGNGVVDYIQDFCQGGTFGANGVTGCTTNASGELVAIGIDTEQGIYPGVSFLNVTDDFIVDGGVSPGLATGGTFADTFTASPGIVTPEPALFLPLGICLAVLGMRKWKLAKSS